MEVLIVEWEQRCSSMGQSFAPDLVLLDVFLPNDVLKLLVEICKFQRLRFVAVTNIGHGAHELVFHLV